MPVVPSESTAQKPQTEKDSPNREEDRAVPVVLPTDAALGSNGEGGEPEVMDEPREFLRVFLSQHNRSAY